MTADRTRTVLTHRYLRSALVVVVLSGFLTLCIGGAVVVRVATGGGTSVGIAAMTGLIIVVFRWCGDLLRHHTVLTPGHRLPVRPLRTTAIPWGDTEGFETVCDTHMGMVGARPPGGSGTVHKCQECIVRFTAFRQDAVRHGPGRDQTLLAGRTT